jgi:hypothetical protein
METSVAPAPLFRDPIHDGAADPCVVWNREERAWWIVYTNRRANVDSPGFAYCHGTDIGIASSSDGGLSWCYRGTLQGLEFERGRNTFWAPEIIWHAGTYHMYVSYTRGVPHIWSRTACIVHMTSGNMWDWSMQAILPLGSSNVIDACVHRLPDGRFRLWYKDQEHGAHTYAADSTDLARWTVLGPAVTDCPHEGPNVFRWQGVFWMLVDTWHGLGVYRSDDARRWQSRGIILDTAGSRPDDGPRGLHADVVVQGDAAWVFYFTHPGRDESFREPSPTDVLPYAHRRSSLQVARLEIENAKPVCRREQFAFRLLPEADEEKAELRIT